MPTGRWQDWYIPAIVLQVVGLVALVVGVAVIYTFFHGLAVLGFALLTVGELRAGRGVPPIL